MIINKKWLNYLTELKRRLLWMMAVFLLLFIVGFYYHKPIFHFLALPLLADLPIGGQMIVTSVTAPFTVPIQISAWFALLIGSPFYAGQIWGFVMPALYSTERKNIVTLSVLSLLLFFLGINFAYWIFLPLVFKFLLLMTPATVAVMTDMAAYFDFVSKFLLIFGLCFQVPLIVLILIESNIITYQSLVKKRAYVIIAAFVIGMLLTPPDVISQIVLAIPIWCLYELGLLMSRFRAAKKTKRISNVG